MCMIIFIFKVTNRKISILDLCVRIIVNLISPVFQVIRHSESFSRKFALEVYESCMHQRLHLLTLECLCCVLGHFKNVLIVYIYLSGALEGGVLILHVNFKKAYCRPVKFKKFSCHPVKFKKCPCPMSLLF